MNRVNNTDSVSYTIKNVQDELIKGSFDDYKLKKTVLKTEVSFT